MSDVKTRGHVVINAEECKGCELCIESCPVKVLYLTERFNTHSYHPSTYKGEGCTGCGVCFYNCPEPGAITVFKRWDLMTETRYCPHCQGEYKVFSEASTPNKVRCTNCLTTIPETVNISDK